MEDQDTILNELLEKIRNKEKRNEELREDIKNKKKEILDFDNKNKENKKEEIQKEKDKNKNEIPTEEEDKKISERFLHELRNIKFNAFDIQNSIKEATIQYITQEQHSALYIMGDFTKWELVPMKKNKDIFSFKIILLKGFKYYYSFQAGDQILLDYNGLYEENPRTLQIQNFIEFSENQKDSPPFDFENDINILINAQKNYLLSNLNIDEDEEEIAFLEKFKRHIIASKEISKKKNNEYFAVSDSIYNFYDQQFRYIKPYEDENKLKNLKLFFKDRIFAHYTVSEESKDKKYKYLFKIMSITDSYCFQCIKLYDNNNIKINMKYYDDIRYYYSIFMDKVSLEPLNEKSELYHLLSKEESSKILTDYNNDKNNILTAYFKTLTNLKMENQIQNPGLIQGIRNYIRNYGSILVIPERVEPKGIDMKDYEFQYSLNKITKVRNKKEGSYIEFIAIDETLEKAKKPFRFKIYYSIKNNKINIIHCHVLDKDLREIKLIIKEIDKNVDPHTLKKNEEYIKNNQLLLLVRELVPFKLYYKGKKVKMESNIIEENKLYLLESSNADSIFNKYYVTVNKIEDKLVNNLIEQCNEFSYSFDDVQNGIDVQITYDNNKNYITEPMMLAVSPCLLKKLNTYEENTLKKNKNKVNNEQNDKDRDKDKDKDKNMTEMDKYFLICQKMNDYRKYNKESIAKMEQKEKDNIKSTLNEYKESLVIILNFFEASEMWDLMESGANIAAEIEELIKLF